MNRKQLRAYMLKHQDDDEAFRTYMDRIKSEPTTEIYPAPQSIDNLKHFPDLLEKRHQQQ